MGGMARGMKIRVSPASEKAFLLLLFGLNSLMWGLHILSVRGFVCISFVLIALAVIEAFLDSRRKSNNIGGNSILNTTSKSS
jgi:hypothetical protein